MNNTLLIVGDPRGNHTLAALRKYPAESITVWEHPDNFYTIQQISDKITLVDSIDSLEMNFDLIIANPPYQSTSNSGNTLWDKFVAKSLNLLKPGGHMKFINPPRWRQPEDALSYIYRDYQLVSLSMHTVKEGVKTFGASTPYDVYHIEKVKPYKKTKIRFTDGVEGEYDVTQMPFIPNSMIDFWSKSFASEGEKLTVFQSYSHEQRCKHMSKEKDSLHQYPIIEKINKTGIFYLYSSKKHQHQGVDKLCFRNQGKTSTIFDSDSGCGRHIYYVLDTSSEMKDFLDGELFERIKESITFSIRYFSHKPLSYIPLETI